MRVRRALAVTDVGLRMKQNQDAVLEAPDVPVYAVADGTGGVEGAQMALAVLAENTGILRQRISQVATDGSSPSRLSVGRFFENVFDAANQRIHTESERLGRTALGTTLLAATIVDRCAYIAHVGNSRAYLLRNGQLWRLTTDHTVAMSQFRRGELSAEEFRRSPYQKTLTQALGISPRLDPEFAEVWLTAGDVLMLCTDGLSRLVSDDRISEGMGLSDLNEASRYLLQCAKNAGAPDNVSLVLLQVAGDHEPSTPEDVAETLREVFLFGRLSEPDRMVLAPYLDEVYFDEGQVIAREGQVTDGFFVVISGSVQLTRGRTVIDEVGPGGHFGELALTKSGRTRATATTRSKTRLFALPRDRFYQLVRAKPHIGIRLTLPLIERLGQQVTDLTERIVRIDRAVQRDYLKRD